MKALLPLSAIALLAATSLQDPVQAYRDGEHRAAAEAFGKQVANQGEDADPTLLHNLALAALRAGQLDVAAGAAERAARADLERFGSFRDFVRGSVAFRRSELIQAQAQGPEAEPFAFDAAILQSRQAIAFWMKAATSRRDWPEARRNVERAQLKLIELERQKAAATPNKKTTGEPEFQPQIVQDPNAKDDGDGNKTEEVDQPAAPEAAASLSPQEVNALLELLADKEKAKVELRRKERRPAVGGRDW